MFLYHIPAYKANAKGFLWSYRQSLTAIALDWGRERGRGREAERESWRDTERRTGRGRERHRHLLSQQLHAARSYSVILIFIQHCAFVAYLSCWHAPGNWIFLQWLIVGGSLSDRRFTDLQKLFGVCHELQQPGQRPSTSAPWTATDGASAPGTATERRAGGELPELNGRSNRTRGERDKIKNYFYILLNALRLLR